MIRELEKIANSFHDEKAPKWFTSLRAQGLSRFNDAGLPTVKDEEWKYTNLVSLGKCTFELAKGGRLLEHQAFKNYCDPQEINIVFVNGVLSEELSNVSKLPDGISLARIHEAALNDHPGLKELLTKYNTPDKPTFIALNEALSGTGTYIHVDQNTVSQKLIHIIHVTSASENNTASMPRTLISMEKSSEATILESHVCFDDTITYFSNALTDIFLDENAVLHYCKAQKESLKAFHIGHTRVWQEWDSNFDGFSFMSGGLLTRNNLDILLNGEGANANLNALYSAHGNQHVDNHTSVDHLVPNCTSNQLYKGILNDAAHAVFNGKVFVRPIAQQTNSYQLNKNLLLGQNCRVDTKPQLEIFADDVKCTHGATIGQLDEDEMFYLQTRGIPRKAATEMLARGFIEDLFSKIKSDSIHRKLNFLVEPSFKAMA